MTQHRKHRGYQSQRLVADYLRDNGWPYAESAGAGRSGSDVTGVPGLDIEVKARRHLDLMATLRQQAERYDGMAFAVIRPDGYGPASIADWPAVLPLNRIVELLREAGYGQPMDG
jgi:hypothetical protein